MELRVLSRSGLYVTIGAILLMGCASDTETNDEVTIDTLPNGAQWVRGPAVGEWEKGDGWALLEDLRIGGQDAVGPDAFEQVWDIETDAYGRIYVLDRLAMEVRVFDAEGSYIRSLGGEGEGPGEFRGPFGMIWDQEGHLWVMDVRLARYSIFDTTGAYLGQYRRQVGGYSWPWRGKFDSDGLLLEESFVSGVDPTPLVAFRPNGELLPVDTFPSASASSSEAVADAYWDLRDESGLGPIIGIPFGGSFESTLDFAGGYWMGVNLEYRLTRRTLEGDTTLIISREVTPPRVSAEEREEAIQGLDRYINDPKLDLSRIPSTKPLFERLIPDRQGRLWVLREGEGASWMFDVFGGDGRFLGSAPIPVEPQSLPLPVVGEENIILVTADSLGVQTVSRLRISRGP